MPTQIRNEIVTVFGGTGFLGRHVIKRLAEAGFRVRVPTRKLDRAIFLRPVGNLGQIVPEVLGLSDDADLAAALRGSAAAINLVGILYEGGRASFQKLHAELPARIGRIAKDSGVGRVVHVSAIGADPSSRSAYGRSKAAGEAGLRAAFPEAVILRPSIVFGPEDKFFNRFAGMARVSPFLPLIGGGASRFQPVFVGDVAAAVMAGLTRDDAKGGVFELGGPRTYTFRELMEFVLKATGRKRFLLPISYDLAALQARVAEFLPEPPLTRDQIELLKADNVVAEGARTLADLGVRPTPAESIVPRYLRYYARPGSTVFVKPGPGRGAEGN